MLCLDVGVGGRVYICVGAECCTVCGVGDGCCTACNGGEWCCIVCGVGAELQLV